MGTGERNGGGVAHPARRRPVATIMATFYINQSAGY